MNMLLCVVVFAWFVTPAMLKGQTRTSTADHSCVKSLKLPTSGLFAARAGTSGTVHATIRIGEDGQLDKIDLTDGNRILQAEVRVAMNLSKFDVRCKGQSVEFIFAFTLEDPPIDNIVPPAVSFVPPNRFELTFRRVKPIVDAFGRVGQ
jgi:hypothetical protein